MDEKLLNLPWEIQLALGSGYVAYIIAYLGIREHHKAIDVTFRTVAFGLFATAVLTLLPASEGWKRVAAAIGASVAAGLMWRYFVADSVQSFARKVNLSWSDETPNAWSRITQHNRRFYCSQIKVVIDDDAVLFCEDTRPFEGSPFGPCTIGPNGDIALYVTHRCEPGSAQFTKVADVKDAWHGDEITYVPAARIRKISFRMLKDVTGSALVAAEPPAEASAEPLER